MTIPGTIYALYTHSMDVLADDESLGTLHLMPILAGLIFRGIPRTSGLMAHGGLSSGISLNSIDKTEYLESLEMDTSSFDVSVTTSFAMTFGFGFDYFFSRNIALSGEGIWAVKEVPTDGRSGIDHLYVGAATLQLLFGGTVWIR